ncbi:MAG: sodium/proton-translocating pyrophosphatase [Phycisphaerales bacterium JB037]
MPDYADDNLAEGAGPAWAIYEGHGKFAVIHEPVAALAGASEEATEGESERYIDGGMFIDTEQLTPTQLKRLEEGMTFRAVPLPNAGDDAQVAGFDRRASRLYRLEQPGQASFVIVSSHNGSISDVLKFYNVSLANPSLLGGIFIGVLLAFLFCAMTMNAVGRAAYAMMGECRRQFAKMRDAFRAQGMTEDRIADPMEWPKRVEFEGKQYPDYATCVSISTAGAQREMVIPALLAITVPIAVGLVLSVPGVMGLLAGGLTSGFAVAVFMANAGGAWDNAKKLLESYGRITADDFMNNPQVRSDLKAKHVPETVLDAIAARAAEMQKTGQGAKYVYGKGSDDHKATVVGDTVGDPFKDTSGPSLNILIKLISIVSVVFAGLTVKFGPQIGALIGLS